MIMQEYHEDGTSPLSGEVFVFGSNLAGIHGAGAALAALHKYGAIYWIGFGPMGNSYAIPTKDEEFNVLPKDRIAQYVNAFLAYAEANPNKKFFVTAIGTGYAGYTHGDIAPLFSLMSNVNYPLEWKPFLESRAF